MSPWPMMTEWGIPSFHLHCLTYEFCEKLRKKKIRVPDIAFAGGFSTEDGVFKAIALGAPYVKAVCMGRALMIPGMVGKNIGEWLKAKDLPKTVSRYGNSIEEIFVNYAELKKKYGKEIDKLPSGAIGIYTYGQKFKTGLQQLMAGARCFSVPTISRKEIMAPRVSKTSLIPAGCHLLMVCLSRPVARLYRLKSRVLHPHRSPVPAVN
jgi:glutamate synthase domain-containing protein 2